MKRIHKNSRKFCFIGNSEKSYLTEYIKLNIHDIKREFSFNTFNLSELNRFDPDIIIVDQYFINKNCLNVIESVKVNFKNTNVYFLSPEYVKYDRLIQSLNHKNHYYSNLNIDVLNHINSYGSDNNDNYLKAL